MSGECLVTLPNIFSFWGEIFSVENILQRVSREVPLDGVLEGVGTLEELLALLLSKRSLAGVHVLVEKLPELVGKVHHLQILGQFEARLEVPGDISEVVLLLEDLADQSLLALDVVVVKLLVDLLEHRDPLQDIHGVESPSFVAGSGLAVVVLVVLVVVLPVSAVVAVAGGGGREETSDIDEVEDDSEEDEGAQQGEGGGGGAGVEVEEPGLAIVHQRRFILGVGSSHGCAQE